MNPVRNEVYLDYSATTPLAPEVLEAMVAVLREDFGNPNALYRTGARTRYIVEKARRQVAALIGAESPETIVLTGGGSEADNLAIRGAALAMRAAGTGDHLVTSAVEHKAVLATMHHLEERLGFTVTVLPVDERALVRVEDLRAALTPRTVVVSLMLANNEVGSIQPLRELADVVHEHSPAVFHTDAVQAVGRIPINVQELGVDLLSLSAHKFYGPKGVGALYCRPGVELDPLITGGGQEQGLRSGTENVAGIAGMGEAARIAKSWITEDSARQVELREALWERVAARVPGTLRNSPVEGCLPGTLHVSFPGAESRRLVMELDRLGVAVAAGSACTSTGRAVSHVLHAMGAGEERSAGALRLTIGRCTTPRDIDAFLAVLEQAVAEASRIEDVVDGAAAGGGALRA